MASFGLNRCCSLFPFCFVVDISVVNDGMWAELVLVFESSLSSLLLFLLSQLMLFLSDSGNKGANALQIVISVFLKLSSPSSLPFVDGPENLVLFLP